MSVFYRRILSAGPDSPPEWAAFAVLWVLSWAYRVVTGVRVFCYRIGIFSSYRATVPIISVGNLTAGGTGKTPVTDYLVKSLQNLGLTVAVVSRGYGGDYGAAVATVSAGEGAPLMTAPECGDEPLLLALRNPEAKVYVARKRALGVQAAERAGADVVILDDGFQHLAVQRDLDIVLLDARAPVGNGALLPAGLLREPPGALKRADLLILTHADQSSEIASLPVKPVVKCRHTLAETLYDLQGNAWQWPELAGKRLGAFAGIAVPDQFFTALRDRGLSLEHVIPLTDHQDYSPEIMDRLRQACHNCELLLTTEKDAVKIDPQSLPVTCLRVPLDVNFETPERLADIVRQRVKRGSSCR